MFVVTRMFILLGTVANGHDVDRRVLGCSAAITDWMVGCRGSFSRYCRCPRSRHSFDGHDGKTGCPGTGIVSKLDVAAQMFVVIVGTPARYPRSCSSKRRLGFRLARLNEGWVTIACQRGLSIGKRWEKSPFGDATRFPDSCLPGDGPPTPRVFSQRFSSFRRRVGHP
jgi:hypothetical protein